MPKKTNSTHLEQKKEEIFKNKYLTEKMFNFYKSLFDFQEKFTFDLKDIDSNFNFINQNKYPMIDSKTISFDESSKKILYKKFKELIELISLDQKNYSFIELDKQLIENDFLFEEILKALLGYDSQALEKIANSSKIGIEELIFVGLNLFKPILVSLNEKTKIKEDENNSWQEPTCPFCGFLPDMSKIVEAEDNKQLLHCTMCEHEWQFKRLCCPSCGNENAETLGYYVYEDDDKYRFHYCEECKGYIKTLRIPKQFEESRFNLTVENIITNFLDASAIDMGYKKL